MKIYTSNFDNYHGTKGFSLSNCPLLSSKENILLLQANQNSGFQEEEQLRILVEQYYSSVLKHLEPGILISQLEEGSVLLSDGASKDFSLRQIVAIYLELYYGQEIREIRILEDGRLKVLPRNKYYSPIKDMLETLIKQDIDMGDYSSIAAAHACNQAKKLAENEKLCNDLGVSKEVYMRLAEALENKYGTSQKKDSA